MTKVVFIEADGNRHEVDVSSGETLMDAAVNNGVPGIDADCGGMCMCATCHIILDAEGFKQAGAPKEDEKEMLGLTPELEETSRLACQVEVTDKLDGLIVRLPEFQM